MFWQNICTVSTFQRQAIKKKALQVFSDHVWLFEYTPANRSPSPNSANTKNDPTKVAWNIQQVVSCCWCSSPPSEVCSDADCWRGKQWPGTSPESGRSGVEQRPEENTIKPRTVTPPLTVFTAPTFRLIHLVWLKVVTFRTIRVIGFIATDLNEVLSDDFLKTAL